MREEYNTLELMGETLAWHLDAYVSKSFKVVRVEEQCWFAKTTRLCEYEGVRTQLSRYPESAAVALGILLEELERQT